MADDWATLMKLSALGLWDVTEHRRFTGDPGACAELKKRLHDSGYEVREEKVPASALGAETAKPITKASKQQRSAESVSIFKDGKLLGHGIGLDTCTALMAACAELVERTDQ